MWCYHLGKSKKEGKNNKITFGSPTIGNQEMPHSFTKKTKSQISSLFYLFSF